MKYLEFKPARCKDCFKCLRECPVKAIRIENHQATIVEDKCILCGRCTTVCPQNAKKVHSELDEVRALLKSKQQLIASVAPSFVSCFDVKSFTVMQIALSKLGFSFAEETAVGASAVTAEYAKLMKTGEYPNLITSACPAINRMIQIYYPQALKYLAPVASPMIAHARMLKKRYPDAKLVFIGPCIAKKREANESGLIENVLTFEDLSVLFEENAISLPDIADIEAIGNESPLINAAKYYPISNGIIKSFKSLPDGYEFVAVDGVRRSFEVLKDIDSLSGMFIEVNCCEYSCINGPCTIKHEGGSLKANEQVRKYVNQDLIHSIYGKKVNPEPVDMIETHPRIRIDTQIPSERDIRAILAKTGKTKPEDELNCGACGYSTCREKAIAVLGGYADIEMCIPYMRERAESMSYEIIKNSPNGIVVLDSDYKILEINDTAISLLGISDSFAKGKQADECFDAQEYLMASVTHQGVRDKQIYISTTKQYAEITITLLPEHKIMFGVYKNITDKVAYDEKLSKIRATTIETTDAVIKKQMTVAQEIASLLGETTAEAKIALFDLKKTLSGQTDDE